MHPSQSHASSKLPESSFDRSTLHLKDSAALDSKSIVSWRTGASAVGAEVLISPETTHDVGICRFMEVEHEAGRRDHDGAAYEKYERSVSSERELREGLADVHLYPLRHFGDVLETRVSGS